MVLALIAVALLGPPADPVDAASAPTATSATPSTPPSASPPDAPAASPTASPDPGPAAGASPAPAAPAAPGAEPAAAAPGAQPKPAEIRTPEEREHGGWRRALGMGFHSTTFWSNEGNHYTFHSISLGYLQSANRSGLFFQVFALLPLQGRQDGNVYPINDYYGTHYGFDVLAGWQWRWNASDVLEAEAGPGLHTELLMLTGREGYRNFSALPFGVGGSGILRWKTSRKAWSWPIDLGVYGSAAFDVYDPLHANDLRRGFTFRGGLLAGLQPEWATW